MLMPTTINWDSLPFEFGYERLKKYLRIFDDSANSEHRETVELLVKAAVEAIEKETRQTFVRKTFSQRFGSLPATLGAFPVIALSKFEWFDTTWHEVSAVPVEVYEGFSEYTSGNWQYFVDHSQPAIILGQSFSAAKSYRLTWDAGYTEWPKDLILLVTQLCAENFDERGATAKQIQLTKSHERTLEHYRTHHDALRWA